MAKKMFDIKLENYKPLREIVFEALREGIISGELKPGERLMEVQLAEEMGVSRTPVREALRKLELEGFVVMVPRKGVYVAGISTKDISEVFEIRSALEALAASLAAERITDDEIEELERLLLKINECIKNHDLDGLVSVDTAFHDIVYKASRNERLVQIVSNLREQIQRFRKTSLSSPGRIRHTVEEHKKIVDAIASRDAALAHELAQEHVENAENQILEAVRCKQNKDEKL